ncbi:neutral/alkaline non-lysosomal ceramidase N-terminal domain-containing protein [Mycobacteroides abscessus]|uniref:neutral/alkaline non-lysosomal ceramidase N-terminal domain-containing protein n=1 Tax=Mycobacteroides abscessus TaxID=36809 RepID=UPI000C269DA8|nr:neutral/alkaline non-lysosomal ceramidase N-terminal domain-containing protein [Mycobacteroides abscessus]
MGYRVGRGISDITGEAAECGMLGYGKSYQQSTGIHLRQRCRSFIFEDGSDRILLVIAEIPLPMQNVTDEVLRRLAARFGQTYTGRNTLITATHTHAGPGGYCGHKVYNATTNGFRIKTFNAIVDGIIESVEHAHQDIAPAEVCLAHGELREASVNRSRSAFERNPEEDKAFFPEAIDTQTTLLSIEREGRSVGVINFFPTHGTSMTNRNTLISGDNKGYAAYHWERLVEGADYLDGSQPGFVAAFAQTNAGDMSPNLDIGSGPTDDEFENTRIIGLRQSKAASELLTGGGHSVGDGLDSRLTYVDLGNVLVRPEFTPDGLEHRTGRPMLAASAMAGTDEGAGFAGFHQGLNNPVWDTLSRGYYRNSRLRDAHAPKGIVVPASPFNRFTDFVQERVPVQLLRIGRLYLIGIPAEVTIVAGLRLRRTVAEIVGADLPDVLVVGYSNAYVHYVTTPEEYLEQRYEGGSTLFGRWELPALQQVTAQLAEAMRDGRPAPEGPRPTLGARRSRRRTGRPDADAAVGRVRVQPNPTYAPGQTVRAEFISAHPNNNLRRGATYLEVQRFLGDDQWIRIADDGDWSTTFRWRRTGRSGSVATIDWTIPQNIDAGVYRLVHHGASRNQNETVIEFTGVTNQFTVAVHEPEIR